MSFEKAFHCNRLYRAAALKEREGQCLREPDNLSRRQCYCLSIGFLFRHAGPDPASRGYRENWIPASAGMTIEEGGYVFKLCAINRSWAIAPLYRLPYHSSNGSGVSDALERDLPQTSLTLLCNQAPAKFAHSLAYSWLLWH